MLGLTHWVRQSISWDYRGRWIPEAQALASLAAVVMGHGGPGPGSLLCSIFIVNTRLSFALTRCCQKSCAYASLLQQFPLTKMERCKEEGKEYWRVLQEHRQSEDREARGCARMRSFLRFTSEGSKGKDGASGDMGIHLMRGDTKQQCWNLEKETVRSHHCSEHGDWTPLMIYMIYTAF